MTSPLYGCLETGGTKFVVGLVNGAREIIAKHRIPTTFPEETIGAAIAWLKECGGTHGPLAAIGIATFGPADLDPNSPCWGRITDTPKPGWRNADMAGPFKAAFGLPIGFDTDVNGAAIAENRWGAAQGADIAAYITVGTGIGGGAVVAGRPLHGMGHPEMGHIPVHRHLEDSFAGACPFHGDCLEGLASGPAIKARWGVSLSHLPPDHEGHTIIAFYIAQLCVTLRGVLAPERIVIGGGVGGTEGLIERVRTETDRLSAGYFRGFAADIITPTGLGVDSGLLGALALADGAL